MTSLAPFLLGIIERSGSSRRALAERAGVSPTALAHRLSGLLTLGPDATLAIAREAGASEEELERVRDLDALDRRAVPLPEGATEAMVRRARDAMRSAS